MIPPPLLVSYSDIDQYLSALPSDLASEYGPEIRRLVERRLPPVVSVRCLAPMFGFSSRFVGAMVLRPNRYYRQFTIPKGKGRRKIQAPRVALKVIQKWFGFHLAEASEAPPYVFGFVKGRSAVQAAKVHCRAKWVFSTDIKDFFQETKHASVVQSLRAIDYSAHGAELIASLCCYGQGLAQGSPASPVLSNLAFRIADQQLSNLASDFGVRYTRYADDIVFSGLDSFPSALPSEVTRIITSHGWSISSQKECLRLAPRRLKVHGLLVHDERPRLTKGYRNRIRAYRHLISSGCVDTESRSKVLGHLAYANSVERIRDRFE